MVEDKVCGRVKKKSKSVALGIEDWLKKRRALLVAYCRLTGLSAIPDTNKKSEELKKQLKKLCQLLLDYLAAGHFDIYVRLELRVLDIYGQDVLCEIKKILTALHSNTKWCVNFNDRCEKIGRMSTLYRELSRLGEQLAERFELEDRIIGYLQWKKGAFTASNRC